MTIRLDNKVEMFLLNIDNYDNPTAIRDFLLETMKNEKQKTQYRYFVETLENGNRIYFERPGRLNKGCDLVIFIENHLLFKNKNDKPPKHNFLINDLELKKQTLSSKQWNILTHAINDIYECKQFSVAYEKTKELPIHGENFELILKLTRWFFIEQDITYWARSGREMLYEKIKSI